MLTDEESPLLRREDCILAVIDVQERLLPHIDGGDAVVANIAKLVKFAGIVGMPILWAEQRNLGETEASIRKQLAGRAAVQKLAFSGLRCAEFRDQLAAASRRAVILVGIETHICVAQTALEALSGHAVHVVADATGSRSPDNHRIALERLRQAGATVTCTEMVMYEVMGKAGTDEFRAVLPLVK